MTDVELLLEENKLVYLTDSCPGISRERTGKGFRYVNSRGLEINDDRVLERIRKLVIPPAWQNVWIAPKANAHLQATGLDTAGRKQYKYHPRWSASRNENKFYRLLEFGKNLPLFRKNLMRDLKRRELDERKVLAIAVSFMEKTHVRVGNEAYERLYGSFGLSTLRDRHVKIEGARLKICFKGKKGVVQDIELSDRRLSLLVKKCRDIPGQELFQYYNKEGQRCAIDSGMVNDYIREITGCDFTAKDFRTWSGTLEAIKHYASFDLPDNMSARKKVSVEVLDYVSRKLGNTRAVCKKYYVYPSLIEDYENGSLLKYLNKISRAENSMATNGLHHDEKVLLSYLRAARKTRQQQAA